MAKQGAAVKEEVPMPRLADQYQKEIVPELIKQFGYKSVMEVPRIEKIVLNMGVGEAVNDKKILENAVGDLTLISGQKPIVTKARKSIAGFKIRTGYPIGCKVTLRHIRMYEFLDRLISVQGKFQHGRQGADHFPRDRVRQNRCPARAQRHNSNDGENR
jgi:ribosomal protein L5